MRILKAIKKTPMIFVFIFIIIFLTPTAIFSPGENKNRAIVTAVGIDKVDEEYEISFLTFIPTANQSYKETNSVVSAKGKSISEAVYNAQLTLGRKIGLSHAKTTVVNEKLLEEDVSKSLDYLGRISSLAENTIFVCTNESAKDFLKATQSLNTNVGLKLEQLINYNVNNVYVTDTSLDAFYKGYFGPVGASLMGYLSLEESEDEGASSTESGSGASDSGSGGGGQEGGEKEKQILNKGEAVLIKDGKMAAKLDDKLLKGINLLNAKATGETIFLQNINDELYKNCDLTYIIKNKKVLIATKFENGNPIFHANVIIEAELAEINNNGEAQEINTEFSEITPEVESLIKKELISQFADALNLLKENKADVLGVYDKFEKSDRKNFDKFLEKLNDKDDFLNFITFQLTIKVQAD